MHTVMCFPPAVAACKTKRGSLVFDITLALQGPRNDVAYEWALRGGSRRLNRESARNRYVVCERKDLSADEKPMFVRVDRMRLDFHHKLPAKCEHAAQSIGRLDGSQRKKEVDEAVTAREHTVAE